MTVTPNINTTPGEPFTAIPNQFISGIPQYDCRVQIAGRTGGADMSVDIDNIDVKFGYPGGMVPIEDFNLSSYTPLLKTGDNVLAIQGLNLSSTNYDFLLEPQLLGRSIALQTTSQVFFAQPTPGAINAGGSAVVAPTAGFSLSGGIYTSNLTVSLSSSLSNAVIHYTLDATAPTEDSPIYSAPINITTSAVVRTRVYVPGYLMSEYKSESYTLLDSNVLSFSSRLPLVILDTYNRTITTDMDPKSPATVTIIDVSQPSGLATLTGRPDAHHWAGIEGRGQTSWGFNKKPMNIEFRDKEDNDQKTSFLDFPAGSDFILLSLWDDKTLLNDFLGEELFEKMGHYAVRRRYVEVFWNGTMPGQPADTSGKVGTNDYVGMYLLMEKIRIDPNRVDIANLQPEDTTEPNISGGYIWKKDKDSPGDVNFTTSSGQLLKFHEPPGTDLLPVQRDWLVNYINHFENALYASDWLSATGTNHYTWYMDPDSFVDQHWIVEFSKQIDGYRLSDYMHKDREGRIKMNPIWDWNLSFGNCNYLDGGHTNGWYWTNQLEGITQNEHIWLRRLITGSSDAFGTAGDPDFRQRITDRWGELSQGVFNPSNILGRIDGLTNYFWDAQVRDFARWPRLNTYLWPNPDGITNANGGLVTYRNWDVNYSTPASYSQLIGDLKKFISGRFAWIDSQFIKAPIFSRYSGMPSASLSMYAPTGAVYYTVDGSDPRLSGGAISPNATLYTGPVSLPDNARMFARTFWDGSTNYMSPWTAWSPPVKANFGSPTPSLAISELMYHPAPPPPGNTAYSADDFEFIELANTSTSPLDLTGMRFADGIEFTFPPGPLTQVGTTTSDDFDTAGTAYVSETLGSGSGSATQSGGPSGSFLRLAAQDTGTNRNRIAFDTTATGAYDHLVAEFDFRGSNLSSPPSLDTPTLQDFDTAGSTYWLRNFDLDGTTPVLMTDGSGPTGNYIRLTKTVANENGGLYFDATEATANKYVRVDFDFRCQGAADGFGFAFLNTANFNDTGTNTVPSFSEEPNLASSIGVGFDIYNNNAPPLEPNANHVSLHWNGAQLANGVVTPNLSLAAGRFHHAQITIKFETSPSVRALVTVIITPDVYGNGGPPETLYNDFVIAGAAAYRGRAGFCARTGGANANQNIDNVSVQYSSSDLPPAGGLSMQLLPTSTFGTSGTGTTLSQFTDEPAASNVFALNFDMHVADFINDANLYWNGAQSANAFIPPNSLNLDGGVFHHARLDLTRVSDGSLASLVLTPDMFGAAGQPVTVFSNVLVRGYYPADARVEFAARSGGQNLNVDLENVSVRFEKLSPNVLAAGQRILLVKNQAAFESRYGTGLNIAGEFLGNLANAGERLLLLGRYGEPILDFTYNDTWYQITDGEGFSLVMTNPNLPATEWNDRQNWRPSSAVGGSPGATNPAAPVFVPVVINEILTHTYPSLVPGITDAIELYNPSTSQSADVSYWYLTDSFNTPKKYRIPSATVIPPGGYLVFYESDFNNPAAGTNAFALNAEGEEVYLFSADAAGNLTGYSHGFTFGPSDVNVSFGRYVTGQGEEVFPAQAARTLRAPNAGPKVGPVVITEVMYHPPNLPDGTDNHVHEFVELYNVTGNSLVLDDPDQPANTWHLRNAVDFAFPPGTVIAPHGFALVVSFDPATETDAYASFIDQYHLPPGTPLFGPFIGKLNNALDGVELAKPVEFGTNGNISYVLVDKVKYSDTLPWPLAADGAGFSLQRISVTQYGNDPINWDARPPSPGALSTSVAPPVITEQPANQSVMASQTASFHVGVSGSGPYSYQWRFNGQNLAGATSSSTRVE